MVILIILLVSVFGSLELSGITHVFHKPATSFTPTPTRGGGSENNQKGETIVSTNVSSGNNAQPGDMKYGTNGQSIITLIAPNGNFVSNHTPGQNGSPSSESSVCNTTPGATCQISFIKNNQTLSLPPEVTDRGGSAYWNNWTPKSIGLVTGSWQIKATATLNGQTKTSTDSQLLVVS